LLSALLLRSIRRSSGRLRASVRYDCRRVLRFTYRRWAIFVAQQLGVLRDARRLAAMLAAAAACQNPDQGEGHDRAETGNSCKDHETTSEPTLGRASAGSER
jgi:hypothetical protein